MTSVKLYQSGKSVVLLLLLVVLLAGCNSMTTSPTGGEGASSITVSDAWARVGSPGAMQGEASEMPAGEGMEGGAAQPMSGTSAVYMVLANSADTADRLIRATIDSNIVETVELHQTTMQNDVMQMQQVEGIDVPAGGEARLEPGGYHVMLIGLKQPLEAGQMLAVQLEFERSGTIAVEAEVRAP